MKKLAILCLTVLVLSGCVSKYKAISVEAPRSKLAAQSIIYVIQPTDGQYYGKPYPGSGVATAQALQTAFAPYTAKTVLGNKVEKLAEGFAQARERGATYLVETQILNWEDRVTEWSGIPDKIAMKYTAYDVATEKQVATITSKASSKWATLGGDHPQDLLPLTSKEFADILF